MAQKIDRLIASRGPAMIEYNSAYFYSRDDIVVELAYETNDIPSSAFGRLDSVRYATSAKMRFTPVGEIEDLATLFPYGSTTPGTLIYGASDSPLVITPIDTSQDQITFHSAAISAMPDLRFSARDTLFSGDVEFEFVGANDTAVDDAAYLFTVASNTFSAHQYSAANLLIQAYEASWHTAAISFTLTQNAITTGAIALDADSDSDATMRTAIQTAWNATANNDATVTGDIRTGFILTFDAVGAENAITGTISSGMPTGSEIDVTVTTEGDGSTAEVVRIDLDPWAAFQTREGVNVSFSLDLEKLYADAIGHYDTVFRGIDVSVSAMPMGVSMDQAISAARIQGVAPGTKLSTSAHNLDIRGTGLYFRLYNAQLDGAGLVFGASNDRVPELTWRAARSVTGGALDPIFAISTSAITS